MKQTAVEWFVEQLNQKIDFIPLDKWDMIRNIVLQAKEMEKEAHEETWDAAHQTGRFEGKGIAEENYYTFKQYYKEAFGK
jgi:predicted Zn-dependent protease with MMP-like domain